MNRRRFLRLGGLGTALIATAWGTGLLPRTIRRLGWPRSRVALLACEGYGPGLPARLEQAWDLAGGPDVKGKRVLLKPNLIDYRKDSSISTDARLLDALIDLLLRRGAREVVLGEGPGNRRDLETVLGDTGVLEVTQRRKVNFVDLNHDDLVPMRTRTIELGEPSLIEDLLVPRTWVDADVRISVPKLKTHHFAGVTLSLKNLFGVVPSARYGWPKNILHWNVIERSILELARTLRPDFAVVDGIIGMEGAGPILGTPKEAGVLILGSDLVAVDATATRLMGIDPHQVLHLQAAEDLAMGRALGGAIDIVGDPLAGLARPFKTPPDWPLKEKA